MTEKEYQIGLELYATWDGCNRVLLTQMREGYNAENVLYLGFCLKKMPNKATPQYDYVAARKELKKPTEKPLDLEEDKVLLALSVRIKDLFTERNRLSNSFTRWGLSEKFKAQRAAISKDIQLVQRRIDKALNDRADYLDTGVAPDDSMEQDNGIPIDPYMRMKRLKNIPVQISQKKGDIKRLIMSLNAEGLDEKGIASDERMVKMLKSLERLNGTKSALERAIKADMATGEKV